MVLQPSSVPERRPGFRLEILDDEIILLHPTDGTIVQCNQTAGIVLQLCDGSRSMSEITDLVSDAFPASKDSVADDVQAILSSLVAADVITLR